MSKRDRTNEVFASFELLEVICTHLIRIDRVPFLVKRITEGCVDPTDFRERLQDDEETFLVNVSGVSKFWRSVIITANSALYRLAFQELFTTRSLALPYATPKRDGGSRVTAVHWLRRPLQPHSICASCKDTADWYVFYRLLQKKAKQHGTKFNGIHGTFTTGLPPLTIDGEVEHRQERNGSATKLALESPLTVRWGGDRLGGDRAVRGNFPFPAVAGHPNQKRNWGRRGAQYLPYMSVRAVREAPAEGKSHVEFGFAMIAYFEVKISESGPNELLHGMCSVGLATQSFSVEGKQPGWTRDSFGYHGDDGQKFHGSGLGTNYSPAGGFGPGDVVGCGLNYHTNEIFFTKNGSHLGVAFLCGFHGQPLYPVVGIDTQHSVEFNFGTHAPFLFDIKAHEAACWASASATEGDSHMTLQQMIQRNLDPIPVDEIASPTTIPAVSPQWEQTRTLLLHMLSALQGLGEQHHFEWQGEQLVLVQGAPTEENETIEGALTSDEAAVAFASGVRLMLHGGSLVLVPGTEDPEDPAEEEAINADEEVDLMAPDFLDLDENEDGFSDVAAGPSYVTTSDDEMEEVVDYE